MTVAPLFPGFVPDEVQPDATPEFVQTCQVPGCSEPIAEYKGKGRRPTKCEVHLNGPRTAATGGRITGRTSTASKTSRLAQQAAQRLSTFNGLTGSLLKFLGLEITGGILADRDRRTEFIDSAAEALDSDPEFCRMILRGGGSSAKVALAMVYGQVFADAAPVALVEYKTLMQRRKDEREKAAGESVE